MPLAKAINPLIRRYGAKNEVIAAELDSLWKDVPDEDLVPRVDFKEGTLVKGRVISLGKDGLTVDIGSKTVGVVATREFESAAAIPKPGEEIVVLIEEESNDDGLIGLSKRRADRKMAWEKVVSTCNEGDQVRGKVAKKIKGGLLILIEGVPAFLPASQVSIRRTKDINEFIDEELDCEIIKIDPVRENIVVSARKLQERTRERLKDALLGEIEEGQIREGIVKNIADFGAFVDLGGIDGLLHITDMTWGRIQHPSEIVKINATVEVKVLKVDRDRERIALGMKQLTDSPWKGIAERYPVGSRHKGTVVNIMSYGAFIRLEEGIEGLVHVSEMSWTKRVNDPREVMSLNDDADIIILGVNEEKQEISLGMKQLEENPWDMVSERYQPGKKVGGSVRNLTTYGAFIEIEPGIDGLLHVSDMSWTRKVSHPNEMVKKGDHLDCVVLAVDTDKHRIALGMKQTTTDPWEDEIPERFKLGSELEGTITKITNFGVFVELDNELEGLLHISELADDSIDKPEDKVKVGQRISVQVIKLDPAERKIGLTALSFNVQTPEEPATEEAPAEEAASEEPAAPAEEVPAEEPATEEAPAEEATDEKSDASE